MLRIDNYKKSYGAEPVLQIEKLALEKGIYWLKGENGAGKTTLLKSIAGLVPFEGVIEVNGISLRKQRAQYTTVVSFAEAEPLFPLFLTGNELLQFYLDTKGGNREQSVQIAKALGITPCLKQALSTYSSGMMKKLSLTLAFTGQPSLLLLDEPFITLDAASVETLQRLIVQSPASFIISTHQELEISKPFQTLPIQHKTIQQPAHANGAF